MAVYAIGDIHGALPELEALLSAINFDRDRDRLWCVGDIINRGPASLETLRFVRDLGDRAVCLMGNHEMRAVALLGGDHRPIYLQHLGYLLDAPDREALYDWLRRRPFFHHDAGLGWSMVHAGVPPAWSLAEAAIRAREVEAALATPEGARAVCRDLWTTLPTADAVIEPGAPFDPERQQQRLVYALTVFTRIRMCWPDGRVLWPHDARAAGLDHPFLLPPEGSPIKPWHQLRDWQPGERLVFGHWSAARLQIKPPAYGLDSGCTFGAQLTAMRLDDPRLLLTQIQCAGYVDPNAD